LARKPFANAITTKRALHRAPKNDMAEAIMNNLEWLFNFVHGWKVAGRGASRCW
jgi:hypothetical protein